MTALKYTRLDCQTFAGAAKCKLMELEDLTGLVPHSGFGGASKSSYVSPKSGKTIYVLERNQAYDSDAYSNDVWQFDRDFTAAEAAEFVRAQDERN